jgi:hypothetical protein
LAYPEGREASLDALLIGGFDTFDEKRFAAYYTVAAMVSYTWITAKAEIGTVIGNRRVRDTEEGFGDLRLIPVVLGWKEGSWQHHFALSINAPRGDYEVGRLANPGLKYYWNINPIAGVAYANPKTGFKGALHGGGHRLAAGPSRGTFEWVPRSAPFTQFSIET